MTMRKEAREGVAEWGRGGGGAGGGNGKDGVAEGLLRGTRTQLGSIAYIADPQILSWWTETDLRTDSVHQSDAPLGLTQCS